MRFEWDRDKDRTNQQKHGLSFEDASALFTVGESVLEIFDSEHSVDEEWWMKCGSYQGGTSRGRFPENSGSVSPEDRSRAAKTWWPFGDSLI